MMMAEYDYLIVGSGLFGAVFAERARAAGKSCLILEKRDHIAGNIYTQDIEGIQVHRYGAHIFHTNNQSVWDYVNRFAKFNNFVNSPIANYKGKLYNLPFNMNTFHQMWGVITPVEAKAKIESQQKESFVENPENLEQMALKLVGRDIYEKLIKGYTEKQWGRSCTELPAFIIRRLPVRFTYDNNYFNALYQGIPQDGYTAMVEKMLGDTEVRLNTDYLLNKSEYDKMAKRIVYTGPIDAYFSNSLGALEYRTISFENKLLDEENYQGNAVINYTDRETPYTRVIEHKHFAFGKQEKTVISFEYSKEFEIGDEPYYPIEEKTNLERYAKYRELADAEKNVIIGGRLGTYKYYDMDQVIEQALLCAEKVFGADGSDK
jgi:UDP-galactopyranose mutase